MVCHSVVYENGIGVMNIQSVEEYKTNVEKEEKECGFLERRSRGLREEGELELGLERSWSQGPKLRRWSWSRGPREKGCSKEYEHEEEEGLKRT